MRIISPALQYKSQYNITFYHGVVGYNSQSSSKTELNVKINKAHVLKISKHCIEVTRNKLIKNNIVQIRYGFNPCSIASTKCLIIIDMFTILLYVLHIYISIINNTI